MFRVRVVANRTGFTISFVFFFFHFVRISFLFFPHIFNRGGSVRPIRLFFVLISAPRTAPQCVSSDSDPLRETSLLDISGRFTTRFNLQRRLKQRNAEAPRAIDCVPVSVN